MDQQKTPADLGQEFEDLLLEPTYRIKTAIVPTRTQNGIAWPTQTYYEVEELSLSRSDMEAIKASWEKFVRKVMGIERKTIITLYKTLPHSDIISHEQLLDRLEQLTREMVT